MKLHNKHVGLLILSSFILGISLSMFTGYWATESSKVPAKYSDGAFEDEYNPADIRGSYSFSDINESFDIPLEVLKEAFQISDDYNIATFQNKMLEALYPSTDGKEIGNGSMKLFVALYKGLPYDYAGSDDSLPVSAYDILKNEGKLDALMLEYFEDHLVDLGSLTNMEPLTSTDTYNSDTFQVKGKTQFQEVLNYGITKEDIESILGIPMEHPLDEIRGFCLDKGLEFSTVKSSLQNIIDLK